MVVVFAVQVMATTDTSDSSDPCSVNSACQACTAAAGCGWCSVVGTNGVCLTGTSTGPTRGVCNAAWVATSNHCPVTKACPQYGTCNTCTDDASCGWCSAGVNTGVCIAGTAQGPTEGQCNANLWWTADSSSSNTCASFLCNGLTTCAACSAQAVCGWCSTGGDSGSCMPGTSTGPNSGSCSVDSWWYSANNCPAVEQCSLAQSCTACATGSSGCGWCQGSATCMPGTSLGPTGNTCSAGWANSIGVCLCSVDAGSTCSCRWSCNGNAYFVTGKAGACGCSCIAGYDGPTCGQCAAGHEGYPNCVKRAATSLAPGVIAAIVCSTIFVVGAVALFVVLRLRLAAKQNQSQTSSSVPVVTTTPSGGRQEHGSATADERRPLVGSTTTA